MPRLLLPDLPKDIILHPAHLRFRHHLISLHLNLSSFALLILRVALAASLVSLLEDLSQGICTLLPLRVRSSVLLLPNRWGSYWPILIYS